MTQPEIHVDREICIGAGLCVMTAPEVFDQDDDGIVVVLTGGVPKPTEQVFQAADRCPSGALSLRK